MADHDHAIDNAKAWLEAIVEMHEAYVALENGADAAIAEGDLYEDVDSLMERVDEAPLGVEYRTGWVAAANWHEGGHSPTEMAILLTTGGPALRLLADLDDGVVDGHPVLEWQNWGAPWTRFPTGGAGDALEWFATRFVPYC